MSEMVVIVRNNILKRTGGITYFVAHNSCYTIHFVFDDIWSAYEVKTAYFIYEDGSAFPVTFEGDVCAVPSLLPGVCYIGVSAGEKLSSELMRVRVCESVHDRIEDEVDEIPASAYDRIMEILNRILQEGMECKTDPATETEYGTVKVKPATEDMIFDVGMTEDGLLVTGGVTEHDMLDLLIETDMIPAAADEDGVLADDDGTVWIF